jgi:hypothetical protein
MNEEGEKDMKEDIAFWKEVIEKKELLAFLCFTVRRYCESNKVAQHPQWSHLPSYETNKYLWVKNYYDILVKDAVKYKCDEMTKALQEIQPQILHLDPDAVMAAAKEVDSFIWRCTETPKRCRELRLPPNMICQCLSAVAQIKPLVMVFDGFTTALWRILEEMTSPVTSVAHVISRATVTDHSFKLLKKCFPNATFSFDFIDPSFFPPVCTFVTSVKLYTYHHYADQYLHINLPALLEQSTASLRHMIVTDIMVFRMSNVQEIFQQLRQCHSLEKLVFQIHKSVLMCGMELMSQWLSETRSLEWLQISMARPDEEQKHIGPLSDIVSALARNNRSSLTTLKLSGGSICVRDLAKLFRKSRGHVRQLYCEIGNYQHMEDLVRNLTECKGFTLFRTVPHFPLLLASVPFPPSLGISQYSTLLSTEAKWTREAVVAHINWVSVCVTLAAVRAHSRHGLSIYPLLRTITGLLGHPLEFLCDPDAQYYKNGLFGEMPYVTAAQLSDQFHCPLVSLPFLSKLTGSIWFAAVSRPPNNKRKREEEE